MTSKYIVYVNVKGLKGEFEVQALNKKDAIYQVERVIQGIGYITGTMGDFV